MSAEHQLKTRYQMAIQLARRAARLTLDKFQSEALRIDVKLDRTVVTEADRAAEAQIRELLDEQLPDDGIVGEEFGNKAGSSGWTWYLDPIDGTQAYARGVPIFGTLIGVTYASEPMIGVIFLPALGEAVYAAKGLGCQWERDIKPDAGDSMSLGRTSRAKVAATTKLDQALFCTTWYQSFVDAGCPQLFTELAQATGVFRGWGDCYGYALVATGRADLMVDPQLRPWDAGPMPIILAEAGGRYSDFAGISDIHTGSGVATNGALHAQVLSLIRQFT